MSETYRTIFSLSNGNLSMVRGDTLSFGLEIEGLDSDLDTAFFTCKKSYEDAEATFQKSLGNGITKNASGEYVVRVAPSDTNNVEAGQYVYDLQIGVNNDVFTIMKGVLEIEQDVTITSNVEPVDPQIVLGIETIVVIPSTDSKNISVTNPRNETPKFVTAELDEENYSGDLKNINIWSLFAPVLSGANEYSDYVCYPGLIRYYDGSGAKTLRNQGANSGYASGISDDGTTIRLPGYNTTVHTYKAGAPYTVKLYYWGDD